MSATSAASIVLVHGGFVDGSGWRGVYDILKKDGYKVSIVQNPTLSLSDDVAVTTRVIAAQPGPVILVGHSYGGVVITEAGNHPKVVGLAYIAAFAPDKGESVSALIKDPPPGAPVPPIHAHEDVLHDDRIAVLRPHRPSRPVVLDTADQQSPRRPSLADSR
jgi:pimeloyl-ACP methyl ester carboxylesterase